VSPRPDGLHGSWPVDDPDGIVLRLWSDRGHIELTADDLDELDRLTAGARARIGHGPAPSGLAARLRRPITTPPAR
jgi:hypothetical protein